MTTREGFKRDLVLLMDESVRQNSASAADSMKDYRTRVRLLEAAGRVFAERGHDRATGREICELAGVNPAAINYHFGGKDKLYREVLLEADRRLLSPDVAKAATSDKARPEQKLEAFLAGSVRAMLSPSSESWGTKLFAREMTAPTKALYELMENDVPPNLRMLRQIVASMMDLAPNHPTAIRGFLLVISAATFVFQNQSILKSAIPELEITPGWVEKFVKDVNLFCIAGLRAIARRIRSAAQE
jgi:AcrR family transcriptional regulator